MGDKLANNKKVLYVANKCDICDDENLSFLKELNLTEQQQLLKVSARNTFGLKNLFTEVDAGYQDDLPDEEPVGKTTPILKNSQSKQILLKTDKQEAISLQLAYLSLRTDMKFYENKEERCFYIRTKGDEIKLNKLYGNAQINEVIEKVDLMKENLDSNIQVAQQEQLMNTVEFEYASQKVMELSSIKQALNKKL